MGPQAGFAKVPQLSGPLNTLGGWPLGPQTMGPQAGRSKEEYDVYDYAEGVFQFTVVVMGRGNGVQYCQRHLQRQANCRELELTIEAHSGKNPSSRGLRRSPIFLGAR